MEKKKIVSIEDRIPKLKEVRKKKANRRLIFYLSIFLLLVSAIVYLQSPLSYVKTIDITGNMDVSEIEVIDQSQLTYETNIWSVKQKAIQDSLKTNPIIKTAEVKKKLPWTIEIRIEEYDRVGYVKDKNAYYLVLGNGNTLSEATPFIGDAPIIEGFTEETYFQSMVAELHELPKSIMNLISEVHWQPSEGNKNKIILYMNDGFIVDGTIRKFSEKMQIYPSIIAQLEPGSEGIIHIGVGAYFENFNENEENDDEDIE